MPRPCRCGRCTGGACRRPSARPSRRRRRRTRRPPMSGRTKRLLLGAPPARVVALPAVHPATGAAPATLDETIDFVREKFDIDAPGADLLYSNPYAILTEDAVSGTYINQDDVDGTSCHHLAVRGNETDWEIWIEEGARPLPHKFAIVSKKVTELPEFDVRLYDWQLDAVLPDSTFTFTPTKGQQQVDFGTAENVLLSSSDD